MCGKSDCWDEKFLVRIRRVRIVGAERESMCFVICLFVLSFVSLFHCFIVSLFYCLFVLTFVYLLFVYFSKKIET